jgi:hypothetical protein
MEWWQKTQQKLDATRGARYRKVSDAMFNTWTASGIARSKMNKELYEGEYYVCTPGNNLLRLYDDIMYKLDPKGKAYSHIPPSVVFHYRYRHKYPDILFDRSKNYGRYAYLKDQLKDYYYTQDNTYYSQIYKDRYRWLADKPSEIKLFNYKNKALEYLCDITNEKTGRNMGSTMDNMHMFWRGKKAGYVIIEKSYLEKYIDILD